VRDKTCCQPDRAGLDCCYLSSTSPTPLHDVRARHSTHASVLHAVMAASKLQPSGHLEGTPSLDRKLSRQDEHALMNVSSAASGMPVACTRGCHRSAQSCLHIFDPAEAAPRRATDCMSAQLKTEVTQATRDSPARCSLPRAARTCTSSLRHAQDQSRRARSLFLSCESASEPICLCPATPTDLVSGGARPTGSHR